MRLIMKAEISCQHHIPDSEALVTKKCANPHGHNYALTIKFPVNFVKYPFLDFAIVKENVWKVLAKYDHKSLDDYDTHTVEELASVIGNGLMEEFKPFLKYGEVIGLEIMETANYGVEWP